MKHGIQFALRWSFGLAFRLIVALILTGILYIPLSLLGSRLHLTETLPVWLLPVFLLLVSYTWAVYYRLPFFRKQSRRQRILISSGLAAPFTLVTLLMLYFGGPAVLDALLISKTGRQVETIVLASGEILENHTYLEEGWGDQRYNALFLKDPATGASEQIDDPFGYLNYESSPSEPSLLQRYPHPQEYARGDERVLVIGPFVCKRRVQKKGAFWDLFPFGQATLEAVDYIRSFWKPTDPAQASRLASRTSFSGEGPECYLHYRFDSFDLEKNILTVKRVQSRDKFPDYLVYSSCDYHGASAYDFPWEFDLARTRAKNGPRWIKPMPYRMALDYSVITFRGTPGIPPEEKHAIAMARPGAKEIVTATLELSDQELRATECRFTICGTNHIVEKFKAMYGYADLHTNRFNIIWQPHVAGAFPISSLNPGEWAIVGETHFGTDCGCDEFIRLRPIEP